MPRSSSDGTYRTTPHVPSATGSVALSPAPSRKAEKRAQASESGSAILTEVQADIIGRVIAETANDTEKQLRSALAALREETEIQTGLVREELMGRMDARLFGSSLVDDAGEIARKAVNEMRRDLDERARIVKARLDVVSDRLDAFEREAKKNALDVWKGFVAQLARQHGKLNDLETKLGTMATQLDQLGMELRRLRFDLGDEGAKPWPETLALPAPA